MARPSSSYVPRQPGESVLYQVVRDHVETFLAEAARARDGRGLPTFVEREFRDYLRCGWLAGGFARFRCDGCGLDRLVPFSCKGRGFCPSCGGRRMAERAAHLVDHVFPAVPVRQWVFSFPPRVRYALAWDHALCRAVVGIALRVVQAFLRRRARRDGVTGGRSGAVAIVQRFGGALNLNVHVHALVLDGVFAEGDTGTLVFHVARPPTSVELEALAATVCRRVERLWRRRGLADADTDTWHDDEPTLAGLAAAAVEGRVALGPRAGARVRRVGNPALYGLGVDDPAHARFAGFDLHAGVLVDANDRARLERICRYALRPPIAAERLHWTTDGQLRLQLRRRWSDGTSQLLFEPLELLERLAAVTPRPRVNLVLYYGVLGARAAWRDRVVPAATRDVYAAHEAPGRPASVPSPSSAAGLRWADLMRRAFEFDVTACPRCGGRLRLIALVEQAAVIERILRHLGLPMVVPDARPARAPPLRLAEATADARGPDGGDGDLYGEPDH